MAKRHSKQRGISASDKEWSQVTKKAEELGVPVSRFLCAMAIHANVTKEVKEKLGI